MSSKSDGGGLIGNHVPHHRAALPPVDEGDEDSPETSSTPPDDVTALEQDAEGAPDDDDVDEPIAMSSSEATLSDVEGKTAALPDGPTAVVVEPTEPAAGALDSGDQSSTTSDDFDPSTIVRRRRDATAFLGDDVDPVAFKRRAAELGYSDEDDDEADDEDWESSEDEYIGLIPMLCSRCLRCLRRHWFEERAKHFLVVFNVVFCVRCRPLLIYYKRTYLLTYTISNDTYWIVLQQPSLSSRYTLQQLLWLPVKWRIQFKLASLIYKVLHTSTPSYRTTAQSTAGFAAYQRPNKML